MNSINPVINKMIKRIEDKYKHTEDKYRTWNNTLTN